MPPPKPDAQRPEYPRQNGRTKTPTAKRFSSLRLHLVAEFLEFPDDLVQKLFVFA